MMTGIVSAGEEALLRLTVHGPNGQGQEVEAVIDTGFTGFLTLPASFVASLGLVFHSQSLAILADSQVIRLRKFEATVLWDGRERDVLVLETQDSPLIGMSLLAGSRMTLEIEDGGLVTIETM